MSEKSDNKKQMILQVARGVFAKNGYKNVTMKDIVDACDISRGGLYLYYSSTKDIFEGILDIDNQAVDDISDNKISENSTAADILALYLKEQKKEILKKEESIVIAIYEYFFENKFEKKENMLNKQFEMTVKFIQALIKYGVKNGEFDCEDSLGMARTIMLMIEGLKISANTIDISESIVSKQMLFILKQLVKKDVK